MYADDTALLAQSANIYTAANELQRSADLVNTWCKKWSITINATKCQAKIFTLKRPTNPPEVHFNDQVIPWTDEAVKYLGLYYDKRLTWKPHINHKLNQCYIRLKSYTLF